MSPSLSLPRQVVAPAKAGAQSLPLARTGGKLLKSRDSRLRGNCGVSPRGDEEPGLLLLGWALSARCGVGRHRGADELLECSFVDLLPFAEVDRTPRVPFP